MARPNILLITSDQQHYNALGVTNPEIKTPALDRMAREGTRYTRAYCPNPTCSPTRASLITGLYPSSHGCWAIGVKLPEDVPTLGDQLQANGYEAILIGKAHFQPLASTPGLPSIEAQPIMRDLDFWRDFHGPWYGFNHVETGRMHANESHAGQHYALWMEEKGLTNWRDYFTDWPHRPDDKYAGPYYMRDALTWDLPEEFHHTQWIGERTIANIERCREAEQPFFLWASFFDPHPPYAVPAEMRCSLASYYGMTSLIDQEVGRILDYLDASGLSENTLVVYTTDHGHFLGHHGLIAKGAFHYEDLLRLPMIVRQPGTVPAGQVSSALQSLVDYPQTFLAAAGIPAPGNMQGVNQLAVWQGNAAAARDWALVENRHNPTTVHLRTLVTDRYKLTVYRNADYGELFDLQSDPGELHNRWDDRDYATIKSELLLKFVQAEIQREGTRMPRITHA